MKAKRIIPLLLTITLLTGCGQTVADTIAKNPRPKATEQTEAIELTEATEELTQGTEWGTEAENQVATEASENISVRITGDMNLDDNNSTTKLLEASENGIYDCISSELIELMQTADICCINNEFTFSERGTPVSGKAYTFRAKPERVAVWTELGVDVANLANNHSYDYGPNSALDTFDTLREAQIGVFGAGENLDQAKAPLYMEVKGKKIAFVGASCAEKNKKTPQATKNKPGILRCYDDKLYLKSIKEARENADIVIAYVHWGDEYSKNFSKEQQEKGYSYIDAGADLVVGAHSHCLQGLEYYEGKPIVYSLGNFWFGSKQMDSMLLDLEFENGEADRLIVRLVPARLQGSKTLYMKESEERRTFFDYMQGISKGIVIADDGQVFEEQ